MNFNTLNTVLSMTLEINRISKTRDLNSAKKAYTKNIPAKEQSMQSLAAQPSRGTATQCSNSISNEAINPIHSQ
jgi:hypothetical protein